MITFYYFHFCSAMLVIHWFQSDIWLRVKPSVQDCYASLGGAGHAWTSDLNTVGHKLYCWAIKLQNSTELKLYINQAVNFSFEKSK